jgi:hypothetical protein
VKTLANAIVQTGLRDRRGIIGLMEDPTKALTDFIFGQTPASGHECLSPALDLLR